MYTIDPNYDTYAKVTWGFNAPFIEIREPGEMGIFLGLSAARRLAEVLPSLIADLEDELDTL